MIDKRHSLAAAVAAAAVLALPGVATAHSNPSLGSVRAHSTLADTYLDRAVDRLEDGKARSSQRWYDRARVQMRRGETDAASMRRAADTAGERSRAARALWSVGDQADENIEVLAGMLDDARGRFEERIAGVIDRDLHGRDRAIRLITALIEDGVSEKAMGGLTAALRSLTADRAGEIEAMARALAGGEVGSRAEDEVEDAIGDAVEDQAAAAKRLQELLDGDQVSEQGTRGLAIALAAVNGERVEAAQALEGFGERMPEGVRAKVGDILTQVRERTGAPVPTLGGGSQGDAPTGGLPIPEGLPVPQNLHFGR